MSNGDLDPEVDAYLKRVLDSVLERLTAAGWIQSARDAKSLLIEWTPKGREQAILLRGILNQLGDKLYADELASLLNIIDRMSPGGTDEAAKRAIR